MGNTLIGLNFVVLALLLYVAVKKSPVSMFSPIAISAIGLIIMYVLRPLYIMQNGEWGGSPFAMRDLQGYRSTFDLSMLVSFLFNMMYSGVLIFYLYRSKPKYTEILISYSLTKLTDKLFNWLLISSCIILLLPFGMGYSITQYLGLISTRGIMFKTFYGQFGAFMDIFIFACSSVATLKVINDTLQKKSVLWTILLTVLILMFLGGRSNILFFIIGIGAARIYLSKNFNKKALIYIGISVYLFAVVYRVLTRDIYFSVNKDKQTSEVLLNSLARSHEFLVGGFDFVQIDALMTAVNDSRLERNQLWGSTIVACITSPIPRALWPGKPKGAMTYFTEKYYPSHFYATQGGELIVSWLVECILNFGFLGILVASLSMAAFSYAVEEGIRKSRTVYDLALFCIIVPRPFNIIKSDLFNNFINLVKISLIPLYLRIRFRQVKKIKLVSI